MLLKYYMTIILKSSTIDVYGITECKKNTEYDTVMLYCNVLYCIILLLSFPHLLTTLSSFSSSEKWRFFYGSKLNFGKTLKGVLWIPYWSFDHWLDLSFLLLINFNLTKKEGSEQFIIEDSLYLEPFQ